MEHSSTAVQQYSKPHRHLTLLSRLGRAAVIQLSRLARSELASWSNDWYTCMWEKVGTEGMTTGMRDDDWVGMMGSLPRLRCCEGEVGGVAGWGAVILAISRLTIYAVG